MGTLHPLIVHLPIGILLLNALLVVLSKREKFAHLSTAIPLILLLGAISAVAACVTGWILSQNGGYTERVLFYHQWLGIATAAASLILYYSKKYYNVWLWALLVGGISVTGHFGGTLTHGENYLFNTQNTEGVATAKKLPADIQEAFVYNDLIAPILKEKCWNCHNDTKQKGQLNMSNKAAFLKGGEHGAIVLANNSMHSEMIKRVLLDINDEHHMSPKGKPQPTQQDITLLKWWIDNGVDFEKKVKELTQNDAIKAVFGQLNSQDNNHAAVNNSSSIPTETVAKADEKQMELVRKKGILLMPIAPNSNYLQANFISIPKAGNDELETLLPFKEQLIWLKLKGTKINDSALIMIAQFKNLTKLNLENTRITNAGITYLSSLPNLQYLNLGGTDITKDGLTPLSILTKLRQVFLFNSTVSTQSVKELMLKMPQTTFDTGRYLVPTWASDTAVFKISKVK
jgi:uncharacterized membrane protein